MQANFVALTTTTPSLADGLVYHLRQTLKRSSLEGTHVLTLWVGAQVEVRVSQSFSDWMFRAKQQTH
ncbi:hypothetical protein H6F93_11260 [Leptolyngbya sp. FACHB-671]|uniref:hypothetical protein n=1 Tax=Leptolyngbya sp. FACHB-671 TaxID=2692812 RepID=UPI001686D06F|nr:hypothetical protein [Leptolyngbya sp. FACHB-671]MBD2068095.1 hypothetical protein [Leptolyngbya sp. FACHB-671]